MQCHPAVGAPRPLLCTALQFSEQSRCDCPPVLHYTCPTVLIIEAILSVHFGVRKKGALALSVSYSSVRICQSSKCGSADPGCQRYNMTVEAGKTYRVRIINAGSLLFLSVCFDRHNVTIVAADAYPVNLQPVSCVDINLGQR